jgi:hypothetical protein
MGVPINFWAVIVVAIINMVVGFLWYGPLFSKPWARMMGVNQNMGQGKNMTFSYVLMFIGALFMSYVLAHGIYFGSAFTGMYGVMAGITGAFWYWLGFIAPVTLGVVLWEGKPWKLWFINAGYYLVFFIIAGAIFGGWM